VYILVFHLLYVPVWITYIRVVFTNPGQPPPEFKVKRELVQEWQADKDTTDAKVSQHVGREVRFWLKKHDGALRYCDTCEIVKPDRTHHCGTCGFCVTKFDHHCPCETTHPPPPPPSLLTARTLKNGHLLLGVNNCVGWRNYKYFLQFLFYAQVFCLFVLVSSLPFVIMAFSEDQRHFNYQWMMMLIISGAFALALFLFVGMHLRLVLANTTTLEDMDKVNTPPNFLAWSFPLSSELPLFLRSSAEQDPDLPRNRLLAL